MTVLDLYPARHDVHVFMGLAVVELAEVVPSVQSTQELVKNKIRIKRLPEAQVQYVAPETLVESPGHERQLATPVVASL
ncbi:hypothetical protein [Silvimonas sp.]|uniref:hypothetical protein n=1 Tax=Silvimonas sp. TaxID=2650811 RepID=UPI00284054FC|nr:hypothetical protein [Silvimonas sp.]MDR3426064.1 hypothetical protein [Silvimonas sp.]